MEINYSFYNMPAEHTLEAWLEKTPEDFLFSLKGNRSITHRRRLKNVEDLVEVFSERARVLGPRLAVVLYQLPPSLHKDLGLLESFMSLLPSDLKHVIEFRHPSWLCEEVESCLREAGVTQCAVSAPKVEEYVPVTADVVYARFHGKESWFDSLYQEEDMARWASYLRPSLEQGREVFAYFNNDIRGYAVTNARQLTALLRSPE